jgi:preprotein translocase subunit SecE
MYGRVSWGKKEDDFIIIVVVVVVVFQALGFLACSSSELIF